MKPASRLIFAILCAIISGGLPLAMFAAPEIKRPELRFTTRTREPLMVGLQELVPPGSPAPAIPRYYRKLVFSGERQAGTGPVLGKPGECPGVFGSEYITPVKRRSQLRGQIAYAYDPVTDGPTRNHGATEHKAAVNEAPWPAVSCNPPESPLPISIPLPDTGALIPYGQWYISDNNPLGLPVISPTIAGDDDQPHYADYIGDGIRYYPTHSRDAYRIELQDEDLPDFAEQRARVATVGNETDPNAQTSIRGSRLNGTRWKIREVDVEERLDSCPGTYEATRTYERRLIGTQAWEAMPAENAKVEILPGAPPLKIKLPQKLGYEIRLTSVTYRALAGNCAGACTLSGPPGGGPPPGTGSIVWNLALGKMPDGRVAGYLSLYAPQLSSGFYSPGALHALVDETYGRVIRDPQDVIRQVLTPEAFGDIVVTSAQSYEIRFYERAQAGALGADGFHVPSGNPYLFWRIENPDSSGAPGRWRVTRFMTGQSLVTEVDETQPGRRVFSEADGLRITETTFVVSGGDRTETIVVKNATGEVAAKKTVVYRAFGSAEQPIKEILDPDGAALTTEWTYVADPNSRAYGRVLTIKRPDGFVESFFYSDGAFIQSLTPVWKQGTTCTYSDRSLVDLDGDGKIDTLTRVRDGLDPSTRMGMTFTVEWGAGGIRDSFRAVDPNASWNTPSNIRTRETYDATGELTSRLNPDGTSLTRQLDTGADGGRIVTEEQRGTDGTGTRTAQIWSARGLLVSTVVTDLATGRLLESTFVMEMDSFGRALRIVHTDGAEEVRTYCDTCGGVESITLRGERTNFIYDSLGRKIEEVHSAGSTVLSRSRFAYDAEGRLLRHVRVDPATGAETVLASTTYDLAGRVTAESSLGRGTTTYRYAFAPNNMTVTTTTFADGGTRSETRGASGSLVSVRGTAVPSVDYDWTTREWWGGGIGYTRNIRRLNDDGSTVNEDQSINFFGEVEYTTFSGGARSYRYFDSIGRPNREVDPDGVTTLYAYDAQGRQAVTAIDANRNGVIDYAGTDRITRTLSAVGERDGVTVQRTTAEVWATDGQDAPTVVSIAETSADGLRTWQTTPTAISSAHVGR